MESLTRPTPTILAWLCEYRGRTKHGRALWWCHLAWPGEARHVSVTETPPPEGWERPTEWRRDPTWPTGFIPMREGGDDDG